MVIDADLGIVVLWALKLKGREAFLRISLICKNGVTVKREKKKIKKGVALTVYEELVNYIVGWKKRKGIGQLMLS